MEIITKSAKETFKLGEKIGSSLKGGETLALVGDLGAGKTTFIQGLATALGITKKVVSPTFILLRHYSINTKNSTISSLYHLDLYRLEGQVDLELGNLGINDFLEDPKTVVVIEWANKAANVFPPKTIWINFENINETQRKITLNK